MTETKSALRKRMQALRASLTEALWSEQSSRICDHLLAHPAVSTAKSVALFQPLIARREVDLRPLARVLYQRQVTLYYPSVVRADSGQLSGNFHLWINDADWEAGPFGLQQPRAQCAIAKRGDIDVLIVPCLSATVHAARLGYGAGFYDRQLPTLRPPAVALVVAFANQIVTEIPTTAHDVTCDAVITENGPLRAPAR